VVTDEMMPKTFLRWTLAQRVQHIMLMISFFVLMITGAPLLLPNVEIINRIFTDAGAFALRDFLHRAAAVLLMLTCFYHILYVLFSRRGNRDLRLMMPRLDDLKTFYQSILYDLGKRDQPPLTGRFNLIEKFEYYAVAWGSLVMILTGLALWFEEAAMALMPKWMFDIILEIHSFEAILAFLAIIIWHLFNAHLHPRVFPMNRVWLDGRISREDLKHHHPLEYEELKRAEALRLWLAKATPEEPFSRKKLAELEALEILTDSPEKRTDWRL
jgi:formate dehydrogenase gamma subunit